MSFRSGQAIVSTEPLEASATLTGKWTVPKGTHGYVKTAHFNGTYTVILDWKSVERTAQGVKESQIKGR